MYFGAIRTLAAALSLAFFRLSAEEPDSATVIRNIDAANYVRYGNILGFTVTEHYSVFRGKDETHPAAEMTVKTTYKKGAGKSYTILSQSGSRAIHEFGLLPLLDHEKRINDPASVESTWFTSANFLMKLKPGVTRTIDGHNCIALAITPRHKAPNMIDGTLWVDERDNALVEVEGVASRNPSVFSGTTKMMRHYANVSGYAMATHSRAESNSFLFGRTVVLIDYAGYEIQLRPTP
jgi:hypothetical protein